VQIHRGKLDRSSSAVPPVIELISVQSLFAFVKRRGTGGESDSACAFVQSFQCRRVIFRVHCWLLHRTRSKHSRERCAYPSQRACCNRVQLHTTCLKLSILSFETVYQTLASFTLGGHSEEGSLKAECINLS
jgi:hypothetical protein